MSTYASGSITDGQFKVTVNITTYEEHSIEQGDKVTIIGQINYSTTGNIIYVIFFFHSDFFFFNLL